jgi:outer membrane protein OmpA-like peptidoglycan-associated protein
MKSRVVVTAAAALAVLATSPVHAQHWGTVEVGGFGQYTFVSKKIGPTNTIGGGGRIGLFVLPNLALEADYLISQRKPWVGGDISYRPWSGRVVYNAPITKNVKLLLGAGYIQTNYDGDTTFNKFEDGFTLLGGIRTLLNESWSLRFEGVTNKHPSPAGNADNKGYWNHGARVGLSYMFGQKRAEPPVVAVIPTPEPTPVPVTQPTPAPAPPPEVTPAPVAQPAPPAPRERMRLDAVNFKFDKYTLTAGAQDSLRVIAKTLKDSGDFVFEIAGHTDAIGTDAYNQRLSERRAESVRQFLMKQGIPANRMRTKGYGESQPEADNGSAEGRRQNRRVMIIELP